MNNLLALRYDLDEVILKDLHPIDPHTPVELFAEFAEKAIKEEYEVEPISFGVEVDFEDGHLDIFDIQIAENDFQNFETTLEYEDLEITVQSRMDWDGDYDEWEKYIPLYKYEADADSVWECLYNKLMKPEDYPERIRKLEDINEDMAYNAQAEYLDQNFSIFFDKYYYKLCDEFEEKAREDAEERYDPYDD